MVSFWRQKALKQFKKVLYSSVHALPCDILLNMVSYIFFLGQLWTWELTSKVTVIRSSKSIHVSNSLACCCEVCRWSIKVLWVISSFYSFSHLVWPFPKIQSARAVTDIHHHTKLILNYTANNQTNKQTELMLYSLPLRGENSLNRFWQRL